MTYFYEGKHFYKRKLIDSLSLKRFSCKNIEHYLKQFCLLESPILIRTFENGYFLTLKEADSYDFFMFYVFFGQDII